MCWFAPDAANWLAARLIDTATAGKAQMPARALEFGILIVVAAFAALAWLGWQWLCHRREERNLPAPGNLLDAEPWIAQRMRQPSPHAQRGGVYHGQPVVDPDETHTFDAVSATTVIEKVRPVGYRGGRRG